MELGEVLTPVKDLGEFIREQRTGAQISLRALAAKAGVSNPYLSQVERGLRRPSADILAQIARGLSISAESLLIRAGVLDGQIPATAAHSEGDEQAAERVLAAIAGDPQLTDQHKRTLVDVYTALRGTAATRPGPR